MISMFKIILLVFVFYFLLLIPSFFFARMLLSPEDTQRYIDRGIRVDAIVTSKEAENHQIIRYKYEVSGRPYVGLGYAGAGNPSFEEIQVGSHILVFYDQSNPQDSFMGYPQTDAQIVDQAVWVTTFALPICPAIAIGGFASILLLRRRGLNRETEP